jgi:hypothetical protein
MIGLPIAFVVANAGEWIVHKYVLHGAGRRRESFWSFHWHEHHRAARQREFYDPDYERSVFGWHAQGKEAFALALTSVALLPLAPAAPWFVAGAWIANFRYWVLHRKAHLNPEWAREHLPWHYDHHMGPNQHANWCVTRPWFDQIMGTREPYAGTEREERDRAREHRPVRAVPQAA